MPRIHYEQGFHFSFFAGDGHEPPHVHVRKGGATGKWWIEGGREEGSRGFKNSERAAIARIVRERRRKLLAAWNKFFGSP